MLSKFKGIKDAIIGSMIGITLAASPAFAQNQDVGDIATTVRGWMGDISELIFVIAFVGGILLVLMGLFKFKQNSQNPQDPSAKLSTAFTLIFIGGALIVLPTVAGVGITSIFGGGATKTNAISGFKALQ